MGLFENVPAGCELAGVLKTVAPAGRPKLGAGRVDGEDDAGALKAVGAGLLPNDVTGGFVGAAAATTLAMMGAKEPVEPVPAGLAKVLVALFKRFAISPSRGY